MSTTLETWLAARVAAETGCSPTAVDVDTPLYRYGLDSRTLAFIVDAAEETFGLEADLDRISPAETLRALADAFSAPRAGDRAGSGESRA